MIALLVFFMLVVLILRSFLKHTRRRVTAVEIQESLSLTLVITGHMAVINNLKSKALFEEIRTRTNLNQ